MNEDKKAIRNHTEKLIRLLYKESREYTSHKFKDTNWEYAKRLLDKLSDIPGIEELNWGGGKYYNMFSGEGGYKEYNIDITTIYGAKIYGTLQCHFAGTIEDPTSSYDMTVNFYKGKNEINENNILKIDNMSKIVLNEKELNQIIQESIKKHLNEGFVNNLVGGVKNAFGNDIEKIKNTSKDTINNIKNKGEELGINQKIRDFKSGFNHNKEITRYQEAMRLIKELINNCSDDEKQCLMDAYDVIRLRMFDMQSAGANNINNN